MGFDVQDTINNIVCIIGMKREDAESFLEKNGLVWRIVEKDGESCIITADFVLNRVNLTLDKGIVIGFDLY